MGSRARANSFSVSVGTTATLILTFILAAPSYGQWLNYPTPGIPRTPGGKPDLTAPAPKTAAGKPDLSGIWQPDWQTNTGGSSNLNLAADLKPDEIQPWAEALYRQRSQNFIKDHPFFHCLPGIGPATTLGMLGSYKIQQTPGVIAFLPEGDHGPGMYRQVFIDGRELPKDPNPTWQGYSVGHWEGDTLVVESSGFNDRTWLDGGGHPHSDALHVSERFHRRDFGHMELKMTFEDSKVYTRPWTISMDVVLTPDTELLEYVCGENERDISHLVTTDKDQRRFRANVQVPVEVLSKYVGVYEMTRPGGNPATYTVTLDSDQLKMSGIGAGRFPLTAQSESSFSLFSAYAIDVAVNFEKDSQGAVSQILITGLLGGPQRATRKGSTP
jgi:hypothetical protein